MTTPYPYQLEGVEVLERFKGRSLLADEMGLGKSFETLLYMQRNPDVLPAVIVCPASLKYNWEREATIHIGRRAVVLEGTKPSRGGFHQRHGIIVLNYDILHAWVDVLEKLKPQLIIFDECQYLSSPGARRTKAARLLSRSIPHVLGLSGTPLTNRPAELWSVLNMIRPDLYPSFYPYAHRYCGPKRTPWGTEYKGATNLGELHTNLKRDLMVRRLKADVLKDLPEKQRSIVPVVVQDYDEYAQAQKDYLSWIGKRIPSKLAGAERTEQLSKLNGMKQLAGRLKLPATIEWIDSFLEGSEGKLIVFAVHRALVKDLYERFQPTAVMVNGSVTGYKRQLAVDKFQKDRKTRLFIGNIQAAGKGLTLTAASTVVFAEYGWTPAEHLQAEDRIHRIGQKKVSDCYYLTAKGTLEEWLVDYIQRKQKTLNAVLDDGEGEDMEFVADKLTRHLLRENKS